MDFAAVKRPRRFERIFADVRFRIAAACFQVLVVLTCLLDASLCRGVQPYEPVLNDPLLEPWRWQAFPELSGLGTQCMAEGADGAIWFGMADGVWRYDGFEWKYDFSPELSGGGVIAMQSGPDGALYACRRWGLSKFKDGKWSFVFPSTNTRFGEFRKMFVAGDGNIWAATAWGLLRFREGKWTLLTGPEIVSHLRTSRNFPMIELRLMPESIATVERTGNLPTRRHDFAAVTQSPDGKIWLATDGGEVLCYDPAADSTSFESAPAAWSIFNESDGIVCGRRPSILVAQDRSVWVVYASASGHVNIFDGASWKAIRLADVQAPEDIIELMQTRDGAIWISGRYVLCAYRKGEWRRYQRPEVPIPTAGNFMMQSADGAFWIAGAATEIQRIDYETARWTSLKDLIFQWESPDGAKQWFLHRSGRVVVREHDRWFSYGVEDGLIDTPFTLIGTRTGEVWVAGSHGETAATARWEGGKWTRTVHDQLSWGVDWRGVLESSDGSLWFSAAVDSRGPGEHRDGILQYRNGQWLHHHQPGRAPHGGSDTNLALLLPPTQRPEPVGKFFCMGESRDGRIWAGRNIMAYYENHRWHQFVPPENVHWGIVETIFTTRSGDMWLGTRQHAALRYDGKVWKQFQSKDDLVANTVRSFAETTDGTLWLATDRDVNRFDGLTWSPDVLPAQLKIPHEAGTLKASASGGIWINRFAPEWMRRSWSKTAPINIGSCEFWTAGHHFKGAPPETVIQGGSKEVSQPGNISVFWSGVVPWRESKDARLQFSFRLNGGPWSPFTSDLGRSFFTLPSGPHRFEVRARDQDFNVDPTPAVLEFVVLPPVWKQGWFVALMTVLVGLAVTLTFRVFLERGHLRRTNRVLEAEVAERERAEEALKRLNLELDQRVKARTSELEVANKELEAFSYSVSHDLRAPLRSIDGFSRALLEDYKDKLDENGREDLQAVRAASQRMGQLIDDMLMLARVTRSEIRRMPLDMSTLARNVIEELRKADPERTVKILVAPGLNAETDPRLMRIVFENLLGNAWKFTGKKADAAIEFGETKRDGESAFFVRDNGVGFDMTYSGKLFGAFQRLHAATEFPGTGIGLATVQRIIHRQGGRVWAESAPNQGATFYFTLPTPPVADESETR